MSDRAPPGQPRGARGTVGHAYSALNLRLVLALFGLASSVVLAALLWRAGYRLPVWLLLGIAAVALVDAVVIQRRRRQRRARTGGGQSLFE